MTEKLILSAGTVVALFAVVFLLAGAANKPQAPSPELATQADLESVNSDLSTRATALEAKLDRQTRYLNDQIEMIKASLGNYVSRDSLDEDIVRFQNEISRLDERIDEFQAEVERQGDILDAVSRLSSDGTSYVPNLQSNMLESDPQLRDEMQAIVSKSISGRSQITIENRTQTSQQVYVNEKESRLLSPSESWTVPVKTGNVSTRISGQELVNWTVGPPRYSLNLAIEDQGNVVTYYYTPAPVVIYP